MKNEKNDDGCRTIAALMWLGFLVAGIIAAYQGDWIVAGFFAIIVASENIAGSIDKLSEKRDEKER